MIAFENISDNLFLFFEEIIAGSPETRRMSPTCDKPDYNKWHMRAAFPFMGQLLFYIVIFIERRTGYSML